MAKTLFTEIFGIGFSEEILNLVQNNIIEDCKLDVDDRRLYVTVSASKYIKKDIQLEIVDMLKRHIL